MADSEQAKRLDYCRAHEIHHLFELLATKVLVDRPENPFAYLRELLESVEESERTKGSYDPTQIRFASSNEGESTQEDAGTSAASPAGDEAAPLVVAPAHEKLKKDSGDGKGKRKRITLGTFGLDNAGKTTLLSALSGDVNANCMPTIGFTPILFSTDEHDICIFDLGGASNFRGIWVHYFHDCYGLIYVVDSAGSAQNLEESIRVFTETVKHPYMHGKPVLVLANKRDLADSRVHEGNAAAADTTVMPASVLEEALLPGTPVREVATCGLVEDAALEEGVEWLLTTIANDYEALAARVAADSAHAKAESDRKRAERMAALLAEN